MSGCATPSAAKSSTTASALWFPAPQSAHRRGCRRIAPAWQPRRHRRGDGSAPRARAAPRRARRIHPPRLPQRQARPGAGRGGGRSRRGRNRGAAPPGVAPARRPARRSSIAAGARGCCAFWRISKRPSIFPTRICRPRSRREVAAETASLAAEIARHLADGHRGERLRDGIAVAILGPPNAGKSSLLNQLARREAAITSPYRRHDARCDRGGDRSGRLSGRARRHRGLARQRRSGRGGGAAPRARARRSGRVAPLRVRCERARAMPKPPPQWPGPDTLLVANKIDLLEPPRKPSPAVRERGDRSRQRSVGEGAVVGAASYPLTPTLSPGGGKGVIAGDTFCVSALTGEGIAELIAALAARIAERYDIAAPLLTRARHREALEDAVDALQPLARRRSAGTARGGSAARLAQPRPHHRPGRCRGPARCDLRRFLFGKVTPADPIPRTSRAVPKACRSAFHGQRRLIAGSAAAGRSREAGRVELARHAPGTEPGCGSERVCSRSSRGPRGRCASGCSFQVATRSGTVASFGSHCQSSGQVRQAKHPCAQ